jgi:ubiquinone/menaquinone biosynthesis C-methylase UbiE
MVLIMPSPAHSSAPLDAAEIRRGIEELSPWFYPFDFGNGLRTESAVPPEVAGIFHTRLEMVERCVKGHFGERIANIDCLDIGSHEGFYSIAMARMGVRRVVGLEPREESLRRARFVASAMGVTNVEYVQGRVENLAAEQPVYPLTLFLGVLYHVMDPMLCLRNVSAVTGELCVIETQVIDEIEGVTEWGSRQWTREYHGILALIDESGEFADGNRETGVVPLVTCPSPRALETMLRHCGFRRIEFVKPAEGAYEQHARGKRVVVAAWK